MHKTLIWPAVGMFALGTESFVIAGVLAELARDLAVSTAQAGQLVTVYALVYALSAPVLATLTAHWRRETVLRGAMAAFAVGNVLAAFAPGFAALMAVRVLLGLCAGLFSPAAAAWAGSAAPAAQRGRALAFVMAGVAVATVAGVPLATQVGQAFGWRATFLMVAALALIAFIGLCRPRQAQPASPPAASPPAASPPAALKQRLAWLRNGEVGHALIVTWLTYTGAFCLYTYVGPLLQAVGGTALTDHLPLVLMAYGAACAVGSLTGGHLADRHGARFVIVRALMAVAVIFAALASLAGPAGQVFSLEARLAAALALLVLWGLIGWQLPAAQQLNLVQIAMKTSPQAAPLVLSLQASALYLGVSTGALAGAAALKFGSAGLVGWIGAGCEVLALAVWLARRTPQPEQAAPTLRNR